MLRTNLIFLHSKNLTEAPHAAALPEISVVERLNMLFSNVIPSYPVMCAPVKPLEPTTQFFITIFALLKSLTTLVQSLHLPLSISSAVSFSLPHSLAFLFMRD